LTRKGGQIRDLKQKANNPVLKGEAHRGEIALSKGNLILIQPMEMNLNIRQLRRDFGETQPEIGLYMNRLDRWTYHYF